MIKFRKEDFTYTLRTPSYTADGIMIIGEFCYTFSVRGESANYLMNRYGLYFPNIEVTILNSRHCVGQAIDNIGRSQWFILLGDDFEELHNLLKEVMDIDKRNYEEYICNSDYYKKDSRWR